MTLVGRPAPRRGVKRRLLLGMLCLLAVTGCGCVLGLLFSGPLAGATRAHVDDPVRVFFRAHRTARGRHLLSLVSRAGATDVVALAATVAGVSLRLAGKTWRHVVIVLATFAGAVTITVVDKAVVVSDLPGVGGDAPISRSGFPSGHATLAMAVYGSFAVAVWQLTDRTSARVVAVVVSTLVVIAVAVSRLYLGLHWLTEVVGGLVLGGAWLGAVVLVSSRPPPGGNYLRRLQEQRTGTPVVAVDRRSTDDR